MTEDVFRCIQAIIEDREKPRFEKMVDGHTGFLFTDKDGMPLVAMHWEHRFNHMVKPYNDIYRVQIPNVTPHVCRHTYTHLGLENAADELKRMEELADAREELEKIKGENLVSQKMFRAI